MHRRTFLNQAFTGGMVAALPVMPSQRTQAQSTEAQQTVFLGTTPPDPAQSEQGVVIHPCDSKVMKGSPPAEDMLVTRENMNQSKFMAWRNQHDRELFPTQRIWRGKGPIATFSRPKDPERTRELFDSVVIHTRAGQALSLKEYYRQFKLTAFLAVKYSPSGRAVILNEQYFHGMRPESVYNIYSGGKPMVGALVGAAIAEGRLDPQGKIQDYIPELSGSGYHDVTLRQVLDMESGVRYSFGVIELKDGETIFDSENSEYALSEKSLDPSTDPSIPKGHYAFLKTLQREYLPGRVFNYNNADPVVAGWAAERAFDKRFSDAFSEKIYQRLGPEEDAQNGCDWVGNSARALSISLRDWARWGELVLHQGCFRGSRIIPQTFFDEIDQADSTKLDDNSLVSNGVILKGSKYRSFFWKEPDDMYMLGGAAGQGLLVDLKRRHVITCFGALEIADMNALADGAHAARQISQAMEQFEVE